MRAVQRAESAACCCSWATSLPRQQPPHALHPTAATLPLHASACLADQPWGAPVLGIHALNAKISLNSLPVNYVQDGEVVAAAQRQARQAEQQGKLHLQQLQQLEGQLAAAQAEGGKQATVGELYSLLGSLEAAVSSGEI